jgi:hypothetical protein
LLAHGRWFFPGTPASSTTNTGRHDIAEILLKVGLSTRNQIKSSHIDDISLFWHGAGTVLESGGLKLQSDLHMRGHLY